MIDFLRGLIVVTILFIVIYLVLNFLEYKIFMPSAWRKIGFLTSVGFLGLASLRFILYPALQLSGILGLLDNRKVSAIIKSMMPEVKDRIINAIELHEMNDLQYSGAIQAAAVSQKVRELNFFNFSDAISLKNLKTLFIYFVLSFGSVLILYFIDKSFILEPGNRIIHYNQEYIKPAPFLYIINNKELNVRKGSDFKLQARCEGDEIPSILYINIGGNHFLMKPQEKGFFEFDFSAVLNDVEFYLTDLKYNSSVYLLQVIPVPVVNSFTIIVEPPAYTALEKRLSENIGDMRIPAGSKVSWNFECYDTDSLKLFVDQQKSLMAEKTGREKFSVSEFFYSRQTYGILVKNIKTEFENIMNFSIDVIEDFFPEISVIQVQDSVKLTRFYFKGQIRDDYGFTRLNFHVNIDQEDSAFSIPVVPYLTDQEFYYSVDFKDFNVTDKTLHYYFSVTDNDKVNNPKTSTSESFSMVFPGRQEINEMVGKKFEDIENMIRESQELANNLKSDIKDLQIKNLNSKLTDWEKSQMVNDIVEKKNDIERMLDKIEKMNQNYNNVQNTFQQENSDLMKKQELIKELMDDVMTDELKKLLEEFAELAEKFNSSQLNDLNKRMDISMDDLSKQLDRNLEMLRKMKIEQDLENLIERVEEVQQRQEKSAEDILNDKNFALQRELTDKDKKETELIREDLKKLNEANAKLKKPMVLDDFEDETGEILKNMDNTGIELDKKNSRNSSKSMKETSDMLKSLAFAMKQMLDANRMQENAENIETLQQILTNLVFLSFEQERILVETSSVPPNDPVLRLLTRDQRKLEVQSKVVKDSLYALANRAPQIGNVVNNELMALELSLSRSGELMGEALFSQAGTHQQLALTSVNNLALLLSEALRSMEEEQANATPGDENCQSGKKGNMGKLKSQSDNLRNQLQKMIDQMKSGKNMGREFSQSLMEHEMMQQMLREMMNNGSVGSDARKQLQQIDQLLERNRKELMNKNINQQMIQRQHEILTRLLEAEKSERERDLDNKRESNTADEEFYSNPAKLFEKTPDKKITIENIQRNSLNLTNFYQDKYRSYVERITQDRQE